MPHLDAKALETDPQGCEALRQTLAQAAPRRTPEPGSERTSLTVSAVTADPARDTPARALRLSRPPRPRRITAGIP